MILADPRGRATATRIGGRITLDELLRRAALRRPDALAVLDPPNREAVVGGKPRSLTYKQAEHAVSAIAGRLRCMGLHTDGIVALQMANTVESLLTLLGVLRAGLIAMPLPALWRRSEMVAAQVHPIVRVSKPRWQTSIQIRSSQVRFASAQRGIPRALELVR
jgi:acyl-CoA synthetase (AMP-forming)/AMP-acid ligase II